jgi:hypothetical protein
MRDNGRLDLGLADAQIKTSLDASLLDSNATEDLALIVERAARDQLDQLNHMWSLVMQSLERSRRAKPKTNRSVPRPTIHRIF